MRWCTLALTLLLLAVWAVPGMASVPEGESIREYFTLGAATTEFLFTQPCESADDILVYKRYIEEDADTEGLETLLTETTDYTVAATGGDYANGGTVTTTAALGVNYEVVIVRKTKQSQEVAKGAVTPASLIEMVDRLTRQVQDLQDQLDRCMRLQNSDPEDVSMEIPGLVDRAGSYLYFDADGNPTYVATVNAEGSVVTTAWSESLLAAASAAAARGVIGVDTDDAFQCAGLTATTGIFSGLITANNGLTLGAGDDLTLSATSDITVGTTNFTVAGATGVVTLAGTLTAAGLITANNGVTLGAGDDLIGSATSDITFNTNKFTVAGASGNTVIAGSLTANTGVVTLFGAITTTDDDAETLVRNITYTAETDGFVIVNYTGTTLTVVCTVTIDGTVRGRFTSEGTNPRAESVTVPVALGETVLVGNTGTGTVTDIQWLPLGVGDLAD